MFQWSSVCGSRPAVMGIVNVTPDSFSDGGRYFEPDAAVARGLELVAAGADLLDVGGESTRPGAEPVALDEELRRVVPVVEQLAARSAVPVSVDTTKAAVAAAALAAGARIVNDVSAGRVDPEILDVTAAAEAGFIAMHMLGEPRTMQDDPHYDDVVREVGDALSNASTRLGAPASVTTRSPPIPGSASASRASTISNCWPTSPICVPELGVPVVVGTSRKRFLGGILSDLGIADVDAPADGRDDATLATVVWALDHGAAIVRVHEARRAAQAVALLDALQRAAA